MSQSRSTGTRKSRGSTERTKTSAKKTAAKKSSGSGKLAASEANSSEDAAPSVENLNDDQAEQSAETHQSADDIIGDVSPELVGDVSPEVENFDMTGPGEQLKAAREKRGLSLNEVAQETRIPTRHLVLMEAGDFTALPARTYAVGFARNYARAVGLDQDQIGAEVSAQFGGRRDNYAARPVTYEAGDPARVPSRRLGWIMVVVIIILGLGIWAFARSSDGYDSGLPPIANNEKAQDETANTNAAGSGNSINPNGQVQFTALTDGVWVRFYDADGKTLMETQMKQGQKYDVPRDANAPMIWTGHPEAFAITIGGRQVPKLAEQQQTVRDVPITASALLKRETETEGAGDESDKGSDAVASDGSPR